MEEEIELSPVKLLVVDENKIREEQAMAKWRVREMRPEQRPSADQVEMGSRAATSSDRAQTSIIALPFTAKIETTYNYQRFSGYLASSITSKLWRIPNIPRSIRTLTQ